VKRQLSSGYSKNALAQPKALVKRFFQQHYYSILAALIGLAIVGAYRNHCRLCLSGLIDNITRTIK